MTSRASPAGRPAGLSFTDLDLSAHARGNTGIDYVHSFDTDTAGPHVMIVALVHGNELCGAIALDYLLRKKIRPRCGRLTLCFANVDAFRGYDPDFPGASRFVDEDLNRLWDRETLSGSRDSSELRRARALLPFVESADFLLDLHSMQLPGEPMILAGHRAKGRILARRMGVPATVIVDAGHRAGVRLRDYAAFADDVSPRTALLVECGQHRDGDSAAVALESSLRFMQVTGLVGEAEIARHVPGPPSAGGGRTIEVTDVITTQTGAFAFAADIGSFTRIRRRGTLIGHDGDREVRTPYDNCYLIMPARAAGQGQTAVRLGRTVE